MFARAAREPRVIAGLLLIAASIVAGYAEYHHVRAEADRDFARCAPTPPPSDCGSERKPLDLVTTRSSNDAFRKRYSITVHTGSNTTLTLGVSAAVASHFEGQSSAEVRSRRGHEAAIVADDGTAAEVPFIFNLHVAAIGGLAILLFILGGGLLAWGFTRVNRTPRTA